MDAAVQHFHIRCKIDLAARVEGVTSSRELLQKWHAMLTRMLAPPDGRRRKTDPNRLLADLDAFLKNRKNPKYGLQEFARQRGATAPAEIKKMLDAIRRARRGSVNSK